MSKENNIKSMDWLDNFVIKMRNRKNNSIRTAFEQSYPDMPDAVMWNEAQRVHPSLSDDPKEQLVQRQYYGFLGILIADKMERKNRWTVFKVIPLGILLGLASGGIGAVTQQPWISTALWSGFAIYLGLVSNGVFISKITKWVLPKQSKVFFEEDVASAKELIKRTMVREFDAETTPLDLQDKYRNLVVDKDGLSVAGQILPSDIETPAFSNTFKSIINKNETVLLSTFALVSTAISSASLMTYGGSVGIMASVWGGIAALAAFIALPALLLSLVPTLCRSTALSARMVASVQAQHSNATSALIDKLGVDYFKNIELAREEQIENAIKDTGKIFNIGTTTGILSERRDPFAPQKDLPFSLTLQDAVHMFVIGGTGEGKTSGVLRVLAHQLLSSGNEEYGRKNGMGFLCLDGKGALPMELADLSSEYTVIHPDTSAFNPIENLTADEVADAFYEMFGGAGGGGDDYWNQAATKLIRSSAVVLEMSNKPWTLREIYRVVNDVDYINKEVIAELPSFEDMLPFQQNSLDYRMRDFENLPEKTRGSILGTSQIWLSSLVDHRKLSVWGNTEKGVIVEDVTRGAKIGINLSEAEFGIGGNFVTRLAKMRCFNAVKKRGDVWKNDPEQTAVLLMIDEIQGVISNGSGETSIMPIARSLGLHMVASTQNVDGIIQALGSKEEANQMLGNFISMVALKSETKLSKEFISERMGSEWRAVSDKVESVADTKSDYNALMYNSADTMIANTNLRYDQTQSAGFGATAGAKLMSTATTIISKSAAPLLASLTGSGEDSENGVTSQLKCIHIVGEDEIASILSRPNTALVSIKRGRVTRRDVIKLNPIYT